jgi:hypothetical protein
LRVVIELQQRILVVGSDNIDGGKAAPRPAGETASRPRIEKSPKKVLNRICGAMSQQRGDSGHESAPQKLVHLVGFRDPTARPDPWVRPTRPAAIKR